MTSDNKRSGISLCAAGVVGVLFFWLTDAGWGVIGRRVHADDLIDAINFGRPGTMIGLIGRLWQKFLLAVFLRCGRSLGFYYITIRAEDDGFVRVIHFAQSEELLERSMKEFLAAE